MSCNKQSKKGSKKGCKKECKKECKKIECFCLKVPYLPEYHNYSVEIPTNPLICRCCVRPPKQQPKFQL